MIGLQEMDTSKTYNFKHPKMKINLKSIFGIKPMPKEKQSVENEELGYDKHVEFYYTNLINAMILFSLSSKELEKLAGPLFNPMTELESEINYAFTPVCFETIFRKKYIDNSLKNELLTFKKEIDNIPSEIWDWDFIDNHTTWISVKQNANNLLDQLGVTSRVYNYDFTNKSTNSNRI